MGVFWYWVYFLLSGTALTWVLRHYRNKSWVPNAAWSAGCIIGVALIARIAVVFFTQPILSDDIYRYIHDGATLAQGTNPYLAAPADIPPDELPVPQIAERINHPTLVTIYQPTSQYIFAALDRIWSWSPSFIQRWDPNHDKVFRLGFVLFDIAIICILLLWLRDAGRSPWWAVAYAWHPLTISEVAGSGHQDPIGIAFLVITLYSVHRLHSLSPQKSYEDTASNSLSPRERAGVRAGFPVRSESIPLNSKHQLIYPILAGIAFALAIAVKPIVLPLALPLAWSLRHQPKQLILATAAIFLTGLALYLPFMFMQGGLTGLIETGKTFANSWAFNGSIYPIIKHTLIDKPWLDIILMLALFVVLIYATFSKASQANPARSAGIYLFASLLLSSTVHPWYLLWALALMPIWFNWSMWLFSLTIAAAYAALLNPAAYRVPIPVAIGEYLPVYALLLWLAMRTLLRNNQPQCVSDTELQ